MGVTLVGAGCGSPALLTLAAMECVAGADHVVYDRLIHPDILQLAPIGCVFHQVGKREHFHTLHQDGINSLLVDLGREGGNIVRLKGGDPFVFGRGGEEAEALANAGVEWRAIPGITSALGGALSAGLPITHRDLTSSLILATGHRRSDEEIPGNSEDDLARWIARSDSAVALYMGTSTFADVSLKLLDMGKSPDTRVTVVAWGGWGRFRRIDDDLAGMSRRSRSGGLPNPAVIYIGGAAGLNIAQTAGSLSGLQVVVCRPYPECWEVGRYLEKLGADSYGLPLLSMAPLGTGDALEASSAIGNADWLVLTSPRGPSELRRVLRDLRRIRGKVVSIGEGTSRALRLIGIEPDHTANGSSVSLAETLKNLVKPGESVVFARNERSSHVAFEAVRSIGAVVRSVSTYRMIPRQVPGLDVMREQWESCGVDAVVFGSAALVEEYARSIGSPPDSALLIAWGEACAEAVLKNFGRTAAKLPTPDLGGLVEVLKNLVSNRR
jgi:uroporphyrinogen III methyltransferase/synthase